MNWYKKAQPEFTTDPQFFDDNEETTVVVDVEKMDVALARDSFFYIRRSGSNSDNPEKYENFKNFLQTGKAIHMPRASIGEDGEVGLLDGRHRWAYLRDVGYTKIPIVVNKKQENIFKKLFS